DGRTAREAAAQGAQGARRAPRPQPRRPARGHRAARLRRQGAVLPKDALQDRRARADLRARPRRPPCPPTDRAAMSMIEDTSNAPTHAPWERFASGVMGTSHRAHLRLAYESLVGNDLDAVLPHVAHALRALATAHGQPTKFDPELTARWLRVVQQRMARQPTDDF